MARPTDYNEEVAESICSWLAGGKSLRSYCRQEGTPDVTTVCRWLKARPKFTESYEAARSVAREKTGKEWSVEGRRRQATLRKLVKDDFEEERDIYIVGLRGTDMYKIGISNDVRRRVKDIQSTSPFEVELINTTPGGKGLEYSLQSILEPFWVRGEWFECPEDFVVGLSIIMEVIRDG